MPRPPRLQALLIVAALAPWPAAFAAEVTRAADLIGRIVETRDGEELGRVRDIAVDLRDGRIRFVVVSVGSFLIEDSLIAVAPEALRQSADVDRRLVLEADADSLRRARRFGPGSWPDAPDVHGALPAAATDDKDLGEHDAAPAPARGSATISDGRRTARLSAGERRIEVIEPPNERPAAAEPPRPETSAAVPPRTRFDRLDRNGDGVLDRAEIAHELGRTDSFADIDRNGDGVIDREEFARFRPDTP